MKIAKVDIRDFSAEYEHRYGDFVWDDPETGERKIHHLEYKLSGKEAAKLTRKYYDAGEFASSMYKKGSYSNAFFSLEALDKAARKFARDNELDFDFIIDCLIHHGESGINRIIYCKQGEERRAELNEIYEASEKLYDKCTGYFKNPWKEYPDEIKQLEHKWNELFRAE